MVAKEILTKRILTWFLQNSRSLPWRDDPTPYHVWVSEIMLQQTRVEAVKPYFERFISTIPTEYDLANATDDSLYKLWEGLGYYSRIRNMKKAAQIIVNQYHGVIPNKKEEIESLPGIGPYTSAAILSIAYNQKYAAVDGNVLRVFSRYLGIRENIKDTAVKHKIKDVVTQLLPSHNISDFTQALMEIGAIVCLPNGVPYCEECPLQKECIAYQEKLIGEIPHIERKKARIIEEKTVVLLEFDGSYAIQKRKSTGLLAGMYQFILFDQFMSLDEVKEIFTSNIKSIDKLDNKKHIFTHKEWHMYGYIVKLIRKDSTYEWYSKKDILDKLPIPNAFKYYKNLIKNNKI